MIIVFGYNDDDNDKHIAYARGGQAHPPHPRFLNYRSAAREPLAAREPQFGQLWHTPLIYYG